MRTLYHPETLAIRPELLFHAFSDPIRLDIIDQLAGQKELSCGGIRTDLPKSSVSHHFKVLREAGVIRTRIEGTQRYITLRRADLESRFPGLLDAVLASILASQGSGE